LRDGGKFNKTIGSLWGGKASESGEETMASATVKVSADAHGASNAGAGSAQGGSATVGTGSVAVSQGQKAYYCEMPADPCAVVMFGASGDLASRKLIPALFDLARHHCLAPRFRLLGFARTKMDDAGFRDKCAKAIATQAAEGDQKAADEFLSDVKYFVGDYDDADSYKGLEKRLAELDKEGQLGGNRLFYLATPPEVYPPVVENLGKAGLAKPSKNGAWTRLIVEKPFGRDVESAKALHAKILGVFDETQVFRIDHYLGKETVQNLLVFRFGNGIFEPVWNRNYVEHVEITAAETLGVEKRGGFYETTGALRDMVQSHVLQLTSLVAMEPPSDFKASPLRNEKIKVLQSIRPFSAEDVQKNVVRGQYGPGVVDGKQVPGYRQEPGVKPDSNTETFVALKVYVDNWRWQGVPFYLRTGKRLTRSNTQIVVQFRQAPHIVFRGERQLGNQIVLNIQPDEGISMLFGAKEPGQQMHIAPVTMDFRYQSAFGGVSRDAYATLINDCLRGDATLFDRADSVEAAWELLAPILNAWATGPAPKFPNYAAGSAGPDAAVKMPEGDGQKWHAL
jgi:glucose-6-phosphate 1-dehydrogenase